MSWFRIVGGMAVLLAPWGAHGFCGTYVAPHGSQVTNVASRVVLARQGGRTTVTLATDFQGEPESFGMVVPVPDVLAPSDVGTIPLEAIEDLDAYTAPRRVQYTCADASAVTHRLSCSPAARATAQGTSLPPGAGATATRAPASSGGCSGEYGLRDSAEMADWADTAAWADTGGGAVVKAHYEADMYDLFVLSADGADGLSAWLDHHGFTIPEGGVTILQEYVSAGSYFLAIKVDAARLDGRTWLVPLQWSYESAFFGLPVRIGTISSPGVQEVTVYTLTDPALGEVGIANYTERLPTDECMWPSMDHPDFGSFLDEIDAASPSQATWRVEYSWPQYHMADPQAPVQKCDPCPGGTSASTPAVLADTTGMLQTFGFHPDPGVYVASGVPAHVTRLALRYRPDQVDEDLLLYGTGLSAPKQIRYIEYDPQLESYFPICGKGYAEDPGKCPMTSTEARSSTVPPAWTALVAALLTLIRRARSPWAR